MIMMGDVDWVTSAPVVSYSALLWQKEASDTSRKSEILMFSAWTYSMFYFQSEFWAETLILLKDIQVKT